MKNLSLILFVFAFSIACLKAQHPDAIIHFLKTDFERNNSYPYYPAWLTDTINPWVIDTTNLENIWQIGRPQKAFFDSAYSIPNAIITDTINPYPPNNHSTFEFLVIKPQWAWDKYWNFMNIYFLHKYDTDQEKDGGYIDISYDLGKSWINVVNIEENDPYGCELGNVYNLYTDQNLISGNIPAFSGITDNWEYTEITLVWPCDTGPYVDSVMVRFNFLSDSIDTGKNGWMIDNIRFELSDNCNINVEEKNLNKLNATVYPNPVTDKSVLEFNNVNNERFTVEIYNIFGTKIKTSTNILSGKIAILTDDYYPGIYFYTIKTGHNKSYSGKFIVN